MNGDGTFWNYSCYLNHDDFLDLVLISSREPAYLFLNDGKGKLDEIGEDSVLRKSFLREKKLSEIGFGDVENIGSPSLLVAAYRVWSER